MRVPDLHEFRRAIGALAASPESGAAESVVVVPTSGAARQLLRTMDANAAERCAAVTRDGLYDALHTRLAEPPPRLSAFERDVIAQAAARHALAADPELPFRLRPGLVAEILRFYDLLRRQSQRVQRFEELIEEQLAGHGGADPGAARMLQQTRFLAETFREYDRRVNRAGAVDEHILRDRLIAEAAPVPIRHVIVAVPDWIADPHGLYVADFDLLSRIHGLEALDIVATEPVLESGFHERLHTWLPGIDEIPMRSGRTRVRPTLSTPAEPVNARWFTHRDREEELIFVARRIKRDRIEARIGPLYQPVPLARRAVVFKRPLPYLYLAEDTLGAGGIPYEAADALPLAAEPTAAALDLVIDLVASAFSRSAIVALLRSPHFQFYEPRAEAPAERRAKALAERQEVEHFPKRCSVRLQADHREVRLKPDTPHDTEAERLPITPRETHALDHALSDARYLGELAQLEEFAAAHAAGEISRPVAASLAAARELAPLCDPRAASQQLSALLSFFVEHARPLDDDDPLAARERRARTAILDALTRLAAAHAAHDDPPWSVDDLATAVRRWIEEETFVQGPAATAGVQLLDDQAARFGDFDDMTIVGLIEGDWPDPPRRNIFYPSNLMKALGWPSEKDRRSAAEARFLDLLAGATTQVTLSVITLDDEALVEPSSLLEEIPRAQLASAPCLPDPPARVFLDEALTLDPVIADVLPDHARGWTAMRLSRAPADSPSFHGGAGAQPRRAWSVSALETYLGCPFKFFAQHVLRLEEEPDDEEVMDPRRQGQFVHEVFEAFFAEWQAQDGGAITAANLDAARERFAATVDRLIERLPAAEAGLERTRLLGSSAAAGLGEAVLRMEAERPVAVVERLLEHRLEGEFTIDAEQGLRVVALKGKADRVDLLADGSFRLIDYKLGWPPQRTRALQLPIYSLCAEQRLAGRHGRHWTVGEAVYLAFKGPRRVVPLFTSEAEKAAVLTGAQHRLADAVDAIERGEFPPTPDDVHRCESCSFTAVCRKDYVGDV